MNVKILNKVNNDIINRVEYEIEIEFSSATPKREEAKQAIVSTIGISPDLLVIEKISQMAGVKKAKINAHLYKKKEDMFRYEPKYILKRNKFIEEKKEKS